MNVTSLSSIARSAAIGVAAGAAGAAAGFFGANAIPGDKKPLVQGIATGVALLGAVGAGLFMRGGARVPVAALGAGLAAGIGGAALLGSAKGSTKPPTQS